MKSLLYNIFIVSAVLFVVTGCDQSTSVNTNVSKVQNLYTPEDGYSVTLDPNGTETFEWASAKAEDGGYVMYEVAFDSVGQDFSDPLYRVTADNNGVNTTASISHKTLNKAAAQAGLDSEETGKMDWTVISSRGVNEVVASQVNTIEVTRLAGFANPPQNAYITGGGTEAGSSLENAMPLKSTGEGQFEIYTRLTTDGAYKFVSNNSGSPREFIIDNGSLKEGGSAPTIGSNGVYRIRLDFTTGSAKVSEVKTLALYSAPHDAEMFELSYQGNGVFKAEEEPYSFYEWGWGLDSRYKFKMTVNIDGEDTVEEWGYSQTDSSNRPTDSTPDSYWNLVPVPESADQWGYTYKMKTEMHQSIINVTAYFQPERENYTHEIIKVSDQ